MKKNPLLYSFIIIMIMLTITDMIISNRKFSELENRNLKGKVKFTLEGFFDGTFSKSYEEYINDQFVFRDQWINLKSRGEYVLGKVENNNVVYGKDNYLFEKLTSFDEERRIGNMESVNKFINNLDEKVSFMIIPNSYEVYRDKLPIGAPLINQEVEINKIYNGSKGSNNIDLLKVMNSNREEYIYYKTDHHWTTYGAYLGYREFIESIGEKPVKLEDLEEVTIENFYGTYFSKAKPFNAVSDVLTYYNFKNIEMDIQGEGYNELYDYSYLNTRDKYSMFLRGNNAITVIKNKDLQNGKKLLVFKDSFGNSMVPFLTQNFEEIHVVDLRSFMLNVTDYVKENNFENILIAYNLTNFIRDTNVIKLKF
ncbi:MAG: DHHW family protein [Clostridium sp.]|uniref:DHHW family protein n=1 Tax=Clostridium sp. TaxID=1506 RepID=UPI00303DFB79